LSARGRGSALVSDPAAARRRSPTSPKPRPQVSYSRRRLGDFWSCRGRGQETRAHLTGETRAQPTWHPGRVVFSAEGEHPFKKQLLWPAWWLHAARDASGR